MIVIGMNSIAAYCMSGLWRAFFVSSLKIHVGTKVFQILGPSMEPLLLGVGVLVLFWCVLYWMYKQKLFLRV